MLQTSETQMCILGSVPNLIFDLGQNHNISFANFSPFKTVALDAVFGRKSEYNLSIC